MEMILICWIDSREKKDFLPEMLFWGSSPRMQHFKRKSSICFRYLRLFPKAKAKNSLDNIFAWSKIQSSIAHP